MRCELLSVYALEFPCASLTNARVVELRSLHMESMALIVISARVVTFMMHPSIMLSGGPKNLQGFLAILSLLAFLGQMARDQMVLQ